MFKGTPLSSGRVTHLKRTFSKTYIFYVVTNVFSVSKPSLQYPKITSIDLATRFKIGMYLLNREKR